jgi:hypothetical protein
MKNVIVILIESEWYSLNIENFNDFKKAIDYNFKNTFITFQTSDLIREFNTRNIKTLPKIIDLESFDKQMSQEGKEFREFANWKALNFLRHHKVIDSEFRLSNDNIKLFLEQLAFLYKTLLEKDDAEIKRFNNLEVNVNRLIQERQMHGVRVDLNIAKQRCATLEKFIYSIKNSLQLNHNIFTPDNIETQKDYLEKCNYKIIQSLLYSFKIRRKTDEICNLFYELLRSQQDIDSLLYILSHWGGKERTYPSYFGFGTITSRIILRQPSLQNLRKSNRDIIIPDNGMKLLYVDYSQFEAGILASLSNDKALIDLYNSDIYSDLAENVLKNKDDRKEAKIIFYRYMYGDDSLKREAISYFQKFKNLEKFKTQIVKELLQKKKVGTEYGNYRFSLDEDSIWALSHVVQSTASYIYKMALIEVQKEVKSADFLIPMHDGTVYQINELEYEISKNEIEKIYKEEFKKVCQQIEPKLNCSKKFE